MKYFLCVFIIIGRDGVMIVVELLQDFLTKSLKVHMSRYDTCKTATISTQEKAKEYSNTRSVALHIYYNVVTQQKNNHIHVQL